jgi:isoleucyl-tRNA synthetase
MFDLNETINWKPKRLVKDVWELVENANDWNLSRSRFWEFHCLSGEPKTTKKKS